MPQGIDCLRRRCFRLHRGSRLSVILCLHWRTLFFTNPFCWHLFQLRKHEEGGLLNQDFDVYLRVFVVKLCNQRMSLTSRIPEINTRQETPTTSVSASSTTKARVITQFLRQLSSKGSAILQHKRCTVGDGYLWRNVFL